jgi:polyribonucleotide nucleotidyltransferase
MKSLPPYYHHYHAQAKSGRLHMLYHMLKAQPKPKTEMAPSVPKMITLSIPQVQPLNSRP